VAARFNPPPNWPPPPVGWTPPAGWQPDPSWPPLPEGWKLWLVEAQPAEPAARASMNRRTLAVFGSLIALILLLVAGPQTAGTLFVLAGITALVMGMIALRKATYPWARMRSRAVATAVAVAGGVAVVAGGALAGTGPTSPASVSVAGVDASSTTSSTTSESSTTTTASSPSVSATIATPTPTTTTRQVSLEEQAISEAEAGTALAALAGIRVAGRAPKTGYDRANFGQAWADVDRNGCDTRNDVLRRDLKAYTLKAGTNGCLVLKGTLHDPYTGRSIAFVRGQSTSIEVQIDHVVALSDAWQKGAQSWSKAKRTAFANDSLNLLAVDGPTNGSKGDGDAATWLPPVKSNRCAYVARQEAVKLKYGLWMTNAERTAVARILSTCPSQKLPVATAFKLGGGTLAPAPAPRPSTTTTTKTSFPGTDPRYGTCTEAKRHGLGPYYQGRDPEYDWYYDRDHDGIVCE
jgi:Protein of unknown function (DUF1524)/Excalibur calcium-binding domain